MKRVLNDDAADGTRPPRNPFPPILCIRSDCRIATIPPRLPSAFTTSPSNGSSGDPSTMLCLTWA